MLHQRNFGSLVVFLVLVIGIGWLIGATNMPGSWYARLAKPSFNPPDGCSRWPGRSSMV